MTTFLKGDTTAEMTLALAEGSDYSGKVVCLEYQGVKRSFSGATAGGVLAFSFTAKETAPMSLGTYPVRVWIEGEDGTVTTIHNASVKLRVTDNPADIRADSAIYIDVHGSLHGIEGLPDRWNESDLHAKINEIIRRLGGTVAMLLVCAIPALGDMLTVQTAPKGAIYNDAPVVTGVVFSATGLAEAANVYTKVETEALVAAIPAPDYSTNNAALVETIQAKAPAPGNYATVSNAAVHAAITNAFQDTAIESLSGSISTLNDAKLDKSGGTATGQITVKHNDVPPLKIEEQGFKAVYNRSGGGGSYETVYAPGVIRNNANNLILPATSGTLALTYDIPPVVSNTVTKTYVESLGISADFSTNNTELVETIHTSMNGRIADVFSRSTNYTNRAALDALETVRVQAEALAAALRGEMENITAGVPRVVTNCVDDILLPRPLIFEYGGTKTASLVAPQYATSPIIFGRADSLSEYGNYTAELYSAGKLRNYAVLIEEIPDDVPKRWIDMNFDQLWPSNKIYATPKLYAVQSFEHAWRITTNDVPCIITLREPQAGTIVVRRDRLNEDEVRTYLRNENGKTYIYERD